MKCSEIFEYLKRLYPLELAMDWDNSGLLLGRSDKEVRNVLVVLDITNEVLDYAGAKSIDLIVSHHPIIFSAIKRVTDDTLLGNYILKILRLDELIELVKAKFNLKHVSVFGRENINSKIRRVAISPGSGKGMYKYAIKRADVLITGDITHHEGLDAANDGVCIIDATHYGLEHLFVEKVKSDLIRLNNIEIFEYKNTNPIEIV